MFGRLMLILVLGLVLAQALSFGVFLLQRMQSGKSMMLYSLGKDVASTVAILERLPAEERAGWLKNLERRNYRYQLGYIAMGAPLEIPLVDEVRESLRSALAASYPVVITAAPEGGKRLDMHLKLSDGTPLTVILTPSFMPLPDWLLPVIAIQLAVLIAFLWLAVRLATYPLAQLARAADLTEPQGAAQPLSEDGPLEVAQAAKAFNAMRARIDGFLSERMQILAAVSHDLQTPITRMRLRAELLDDATQRDRMLYDLQAMQMLVEEGIAYARNAHGLNETPCRTDLDALLGSLVYDYTDAGQAVRLSGELKLVLLTRPHALRRIVTNLADNALKFGKDVEIVLAREAGGRYSISVLDRGPGIPAEEREAVMQPFYRIESSRNRDTGGTGLGLAIVQQLTLALGGTLSLAQREGGGLAAQVLLPAA
ncbi:ATP-binding protein [Massilia sp. erpn]|uniref:ATP-binding protein n=1 Tax=Massilia sp. erpn TaxID=2738142 RepID=UPI00210250AF|nr:ATP-binding protein [Massilia sp. erpn]UTY60089.1 two-component sensor histidine kinase [Massilia sp. erpn]